MQFIFGSLQILVFQYLKITVERQELHTMDKNKEKHTELADDNPEKGLCRLFWRDTGVKFEGE